jgi:hypothetical protein
VREKFSNWASPYLIVFDNYDNPSAFNLQDYMPEGEHSRIVVTSRHADTESLADPDNLIQLQGLHERAALTLLLKQSALKESESNYQHGKTIIEKFGYHALAITQAGSYVKLQQIGLHQFMEHYNRQKSAILRQTPQMSQYKKGLTETEEETAMNVFTTWELSFSQLEAKYTKASAILTLFAIFDCKDISEELYLPHHRKNKNISFLGSQFSLSDTKSDWKKDDFVAVLIILTQMSLVQSWSREEHDGYSYLSIHPLVKDWIRMRT